MTLSRIAKTFVVLTIPVLCFFISGCDESSGEVNVNEPKNENNTPSSPTSDVTGTWTGTISGYGETITASMNIAQDGDNVAGTYILDHEGDVDTGTVSGTISSGSGTFTFTSGGGTVADGNFAFSDNTATGTFTYGNLTLSITMTRS